MEETPGAARLNAALARLADTLQQQAAETETHRRQHADYAAIFDAAPALIWYKDTENRILRLNEAAAAAMGRTVAEVEGRSVYDLHDRADAEQYHQDDLEVINSAQPKLGIVEALRSPEGETRWIQTDKVPTFDAEGNVTGVVVVAQDVTAQKATEQALVASHTELETLVRERTTALEAERSLLRALIDSLPDNVFVKDAESRIILDNEAHRRLLGAATEAEVVGRSDFDFFEAELAEQYFADEQRILQTGEARLNYEEPSVDPEGNRRWLSTTKVPFRDSQGNVVGIIGINHDITNRKQMEEQLAEERNLLRTLVDALPDIVYVKDAESRFLLINDIHARLLGEARIEDTLGKTDYDYYPREMADSFRADDLHVIQSGEPVTHEERALGADGEEIWILTTKAPFRDASGNVIGLVGIGRDLTERKRAEEALANERNLLRTLIDTLPDVIYAKDAESRFAMGNAALTRQLGAPSLDAMIGKTDFDFHPRELAEQYFADEQAIMQSGEPLIDREEVVVDAATGETRWFQTTKAPVKDAAGRVVGLVGIGRDVTARKQAEAEREQLLSGSAAQ
ncbi:MAG: PAS domain-containing protein [Anaerolineae bacterium]|nr:PAS domain-containing protein [Anaerolineae bacterium]